LSFNGTHHLSPYLRNCYSLQCFLFHGLF
jgi:hypothetical protein